MTSEPRTPRRLRILAAVAALAIGAAGLFAAAPASAHDALVSTDPPADTTLETLPAELTLTFSAELLDGGGNEVIVTDAAGAALTDGPTAVEGTNLVQPLTSEGASGAITVVWRAVSSDGHPISGQYAFTVTAPPTTAPTATTEPSASPEPSATASAEPDESATPSPEPTTDADAASPLPWIILGVVLLVAAGVIIALLVRRARRADGDEPGSDGTTGR